MLPLLIVCIALSVISAILYPKWTIVMLSAALAYGSLSPLIASRRLYFLSAASAHIALLAVVLSIPLSYLAFNGYFWAVIIGLSLIYAVGYAIHSGIDEDVATAVFVSFSASASVIAMYFVLSKYSLEYDLWSIILGDPLLVGWKEAIALAAVSILIFLVTVLSYRENVIIGVERDTAVVSGIRVWFYDFTLYTLLGIAAIAMIGIVGFVLEHVLILLPAAISMSIAKDSKGMLTTSILISLISAMAGLQISVLTNQAPSGVIGLIMFTLYILALAVKRCRYG